MQLPKYTKMKLAILNWISKNELKVGDRLPSEREISDIFSLSRITVRHALNDLVETGYLKKLPQSGYYLLKPIAVAEHSTNIGFLMVGRSERMPSGYSPGRLFRTIPYQEMKMRGVEILAKYEEDVNAPLLPYFSTCAGLLMTDWVTDEWVRMAGSLEIPLCCVGNNLCRKEKIFTIDFDHEYTVREQLKLLAGHGCRKIVIVIANCDMPSAHIMEKAYRDFMKEYGLELEERRIVKIRYSGGAADMMEGLARNDDCDAVMCDKLPDIFQYRKLGWTHNPKFALLTGQQRVGSGSLQAIFPYFRKDIYGESANILMDHILMDTELPEKLLLKPEIIDQTFI